MKYIAIWLGAVASLTLLSVVLYGGYLLLRAVAADPVGLVAVPLIALGVVSVATLAAVVEYLTDHRAPTIDEVEQ